MDYLQLHIDISVEGKGTSSGIPHLKLSSVISNNLIISYYLNHWQSAMAPKHRWLKSADQMTQLGRNKAISVA